MHTISLAGSAWSLRDALGDTWAWHAAAAPPAAGNDAPRNNAADAAAAATRTPGWLPVAVPGSVIDQLHAAGELDDPRVGRNSRSAEWTSARHWVYRRPVELAALAEGEHAVLELDGVDPGAIVLWDGEELGRMNGLYHPGRFDVGRPAAGIHQLVVVVLPSPESEPQVGRTERVRLHAPRMGYGWDFCPRFLHQGIWKGARLRIGRELLAEVTARTEYADGVGRVLAGVVADAALVGGAAVDAAPARVRAELLLAGSVVAAAAVTAENGLADIVLDIPQPELWWPAGLGEQSTYELRVSTADDSRSLRVGFRSAELVPNPGASGDALSYTAVVNGTVVPLVGWNWVPVDAQFGSITPQRVEHLVALAAASGARVLRVWGGGLLESEEFYDACDEAGLLVWQEFSQSSSGMQSAPAADPGFVDYLRGEADAIIPTLTHHPSLLIWGGGNELDEGGIPLDEARSPALAALRDSVALRDPGRHWVATSPTGPVFHNRLDAIAAAPDDQHDVHGPWEHQGLVAHHTLYNAGASLAHTEFGVEGMTNRRSFEALVPEADRWPADRSNAVYRHLGDWWNNAPLVQESFGNRIDDVDTLRRASQWLQATGLAYAVEADRRRAPRCSMVIPWQLGESYPNAWCTSAIDYRGEAKPAYHSIARAFQRERVTIATTRSAWGGEQTARADAWLWSEAGRPPSAVTLRALTLRGEVLAEQHWRPGEVRHPVLVGSLELPLDDTDDLFLWEARWRDEHGAELDREVVLATADVHLGALLELGKATLDVERTAQGIRVTHTSGPAVIGLQLSDARPIGDEGFVIASGDPRPLLPGGSRTFAIETRHCTAPWRLTLESWNTDQAAIEQEHA